MKSLKIIVGGYIGLYPTGGATWDYIQYPLGLRMLGHDVYYIEDTSQYPVYQLEKDSWDDCSHSVKYLANAMNEAGMADRWAYRDVATGKLFGMSEQKLRSVLEETDVLFNVSASTVLRHEYSHIPVKIFIDTDPMFTQYQYYLTQQAGGTVASKSLEFMKAHNLHFTFGLNINSSDCRVPKFDFTWYSTVKPICLKFWENDKTHKPKFGFSSILNWTERPPFLYDNESWGQKNFCSKN